MQPPRRRRDAIPKNPAHGRFSALSGRRHGGRDCRRIRATPPPPHIYKTAGVWLVRAEDTNPPGGPGADAPRPVDAECGAMTEWQKEIYDVPKAGAALLAG